MSFTAYMTFVAGSVLTAANLNQQLRDNGNYLVSVDAAIRREVSTDLAYCTNFESMNRFGPTYITGSGTHQVTTVANGGGAFVQTLATAGSSAGFMWQLSGFANTDLRSNFRPVRMQVRCGIYVKGTDAHVYVGLGAPTVAGAGITFTPNHIGFKITWSASGVASLYATQANSIENVSGALTTVVAGDELDLVIVGTSGVSTDYYFSKNGAALSGPTTLSANYPTGVLQGFVGAISNVGQASNSVLLLSAASINFSSAP